MSKSIDKELHQHFLEIIQENEALIYKVVSFYANNEHPRNDLYQEVVLNLWKAYPSFRGESKISTWMYRIALNTCISFYRRKNINLNYTDNFVDVMEEIPMDDNLKDLYKLINKLNDIEKALVLLYLEDKSYKEIAEITGITMTNVATRLNRIKIKMKLMSDDLNEDSL